MKAIYRLFPLFVFLAFILSCSNNLVLDEIDDKKDINKEETPTSQQVIKFSTTETITKTVFGEKTGDVYPTLWEGTETVSLFTDAGKVADLEVNGSGKTTQMEYTPTESPANGTKFMFLSPSSAASSTTSPTYLIPTEQTPTANSVDPSAQVLYGECVYNTDGNDNLVIMNHMAAYGKVSLLNLKSTQNISSITLAFTEENSVSNIKINTNSVTGVWFARVPSTNYDTNPDFVKTLLVTVKYSDGTDDYSKSFDLATAVKKLTFKPGEISKFSLDMAEPLPVEEVLKNSILKDESEYNIIAPISTERFSTERGLLSVKYKLTDKHLLGIAKIDTLVARTYVKNILSYLFVWIDVPQTAGTGGGWLNSSYKNYDIVLGGLCSNIPTGNPLIWSPKLYDCSSSGDAIGKDISQSGTTYAYGEGEIKDNVLTYYFSVDRRSVGLLEVDNEWLSNSHVNLMFSESSSCFTEHVIIPHRGGCEISKSKKLDDLVEEVKITKPTSETWFYNPEFEIERGDKYQYARGFASKQIYFKYDNKYVYGYLELDMNASGMNTAFLNNFIICYDLNAPDQTKGFGWLFAGYKGYQYRLLGPAVTNGTPNYIWNGVYGISKSNDTFGTDSSDIKNAALGRGFIDENMFKYVFIMDREKLSITETGTLHLAVGFYQSGYDGSKCTIPYRPGYIINL